MELPEVDLIERNIVHMKTEREELFGLLSYNENVFVCKREIASFPSFQMVRLKLYITRVQNRLENRKILELYIYKE